MRRPRAGAALAIAGLLLAGAPATAHAGTRPSSPPMPKPTSPGHSYTVTLLTGDVVHVHTQTGGPPLVSVDPGPGRRSMVFRKDIRPDGTVNVVPLDVSAKLGSVYDPALFDITTLIKEGDDDAHRSDLPLIVQHGSGMRALAAGRTLSNLGATAVRQPKKQALTPKAASAAGVRHIWLDHKVRASALDHNLDQIGAPTAWKAGATGKGVKVAVLDTGVDANHPDLKGRIAEQKNFTTTADTVDHYGHGTHVAATIAGTGAAAGGERRGVAPDADLLIGKVLGDDGGGDESDVIAGMEWAAANAPIVSMSLGEFTDDPANDPVSKTLDDLSAKDGTLFVVAAGNDGARDTVESPGVAASALTVGAVDGQDRLADFSSRGGGTLLKPEIAAPGVGIVAARAAGTAMGNIVDANYTSADGTSMATPHVTGAAADLLQKHPSWDGARLKAALVSTADAASGTVYQVGAGRLDVGTATTATVTADQATASFGSIPHGSTASMTKQLTWTNSGKSSVTLRLATTFSDTHGTAAAALNLPATVTVPAGKSAGVTLSLDPGKLAASGEYGGIVTAKAAGVSLRTPVGAFAEPQTHTLTLKATALPDTPDGALSGYVNVVDLDDSTLFLDGASIDTDGTATLTVPDGRYLILGEVDDTTSGKERAAVVGNAELGVHDDTTLTLDASRAQPLRVSAPGMTTDPGGVTGLQVERGFGDDIWGLGLVTFQGTPTVYTTPIAAAPTGTLRSYVFTRLSDGGKTVEDILHDLGPSVPASVDYQVDQKSLARVNQRYDALGGDTTNPVGEKRYGVDPAGFLASEGDGQAPAGSTRTDYVSTDPGIGWLEEAVPPYLDGLWVTEVPLRRYAPGSTQTDEWLRQPFRPGPYSATGVTASGCAPHPTTRSRGNIHVEMVDLQDLPDGFDCLTDTPEWDDASTRTMKLYAGDTLAGTTDKSYGDFSVPATAGTFRLDYDVDASQVLPVSTKTTTEWTFRSRPDETRVPLLLVDYGLPLDPLGHPNGDTATFTVSRVAGAATAKATGLKLWTSLDDGVTWQAAKVASAGGKYTATLPHAGKGQFVSLRVRATDAGGGAIDQTIIRAYNGA